MLVKILGALDILAGIIFWLSFPFPIPAIILGIFGIYVLAKGLIFVGFGLDVLSAIDIIAGILIIASVSISMPVILISVISIYLIGKGLFSLA
ncbi:MAG TPA: hypothetical protein VJ438_04260 [Candidatus Nanoarchaeia archaeon]|nr:hypothetical protein [Candidatus Nanoarchaeia archaeon]